MNQLQVELAALKAENERLRQERDLFADAGHAAELRVVKLRQERDQLFTNGIEFSNMNARLQDEILALKAELAALKPKT